MNNTGQKFGGRKSGTSNKDKTNIRTTFQLLVENNLKHIETTAVIFEATVISCNNIRFIKNEKKNLALIFIIYP